MFTYFGQLCYGHPGQLTPAHSKKQFSAYGEVAYCIDIASRI